MDFGPGTLINLANIFSTWGAAFLAAVWLSLIFWTYRDAKSRMHESMPRFLATLVVVLLFIPGVFVYLILRPPETLEDRYLRTLEEEALLRAIEESGKREGK